MSGALSARQIPTVPDKVYTDVEGTIEKLDRTIVITNVKLNYHLKIPRGKREVAERVLAIHEQGCPVHQSIKRGINVSWTADIEEED